MARAPDIETTNTHSPEPKPELNPKLEPEQAYQSRRFSLNPVQQEDFTLEYLRFAFAKDPEQLYAQINHALERLHTAEERIKTLESQRQDTAKFLIENKNPQADLPSQTLNSRSPASPTHKHEDTMNGCPECFICGKYVRPVSYTWSCRFCSRILHLSCVKAQQDRVKLLPEKQETMEGWHCPACDNDPLQNIPVLSKENPQYPGSQQTFEEMDKSINYDNDTDSETIVADDNKSLLKKHKGSILGIDILIKATKAQLAETAKEFHRLRQAGMKINNLMLSSQNKLGHQHACLVNVQQFILHHEREPFTSGLFYAPLFALDCLVAENKGHMEKVEQEFNHFHKVGMLDDQLKVLSDRHSSLERQHGDLMETRKYILDFASLDSSQAL